MPTANWVKHRSKNTSWSSTKQRVLIVEHSSKKNTVRHTTLLEALEVVAPAIFNSNSWRVRGSGTNHRKQHHKEIGEEMMAASSIARTLYATTGEGCASKQFSGHETPNRTLTFEFC
jgi:hypothetical protein